MTKIIFSIALIVTLFSTFNSYAQLPAFPGAEGFGKYTVGGRGGQVIYVTNLNDSGAGSLREAINTSGPRTVLFKVGGLITVNSPLVISDPYISILGQSAPGDGIAITSSNESGAGIQISASEVIIRYIRVRRGTTLTYNGSADAFYIESGENIILDHCSMAFANDENLGIARYGADPTQNITIQYCIISNPYGGSSKGSLCVRDINNVTFFRNAFLSNVTRNPYMSPQQDNPDYDTYFELVNNVIYNGKYYIEVTRDDSYATNPGASTGVPQYNVINNYARISTDTSPFQKNPERQMILSYDPYPLKIFAKGNIHPLRPTITNNVPYDQYSASDWAEEWATTQGADGFSNLNTPAIASKQAFIPIATPIITDNVTVYDADDVWDNIRTHVGASYPSRDSHDAKMVNETDTQTRTDSYVSNALPIYNNASNNSPYTDVNDDGIEDTWFTVNVTPGDIANDASPIGYTWVENYLNEISNGQIPDIPAESVLVTPNTATINVPNTLPLLTTFTPINTTNKNGVWISSDESVATVSSDGIVTAVAQGAVTITFTSNDGGFFDSADITVTNITIDVESLAVSPNTLTLDLGETYQAIVDFIPANATNQNGTWSSSNPSVANVDVNGNIIGLVEGDAIISFTSSENASFTDEILVTVEDVFFGTYEFYNADTDLLIELIGGDSSFDLNNIGNQVNFRSIPQGGDDNTEVESVRVDWSGPTSGTWSESGPIYAGLPNGHVGLNFESYIVEEGTYNFTITYYSADGALGDIVAIDTFSLTFFFDNSLTADAGEDVSICEGESTTLVASGGTTYLWNTGESTATIEVNPTLTTTYSVVVSNDQGDEDIDEVIVTVNEVPIADAGEDQTICQGESTTLVASGGTSYLWSTGETTNSIEVSPTSETTYSVEVISNNCSSTDSVTITVNETPDISVSNDIAIMDGDSATLTANGGSNYQWNTGETTAAIIVSPTTTTTYTVTSLGAGGCEDSEQVNVTVIPELIANAGADTAICSGESTTLNASGGIIYAWNTGETGSQLTVSPTVTTTYTVTVEDGFGNSDTDSVTITVNEMPNISVSNDVAIMDGDSATLTANGGSNYQWNTGETTAAIIVSPTTTTTYTVTSLGAGGCEDSEQVTVTVIPELIADAGADTAICSGESITLNASGGITYTWNTGETGSQLTVSPTVTTTYTVTVEDGFGNSDTDNVTITVNEIPNIDLSDNITIVEGESIDLVVSGAQTYQWSTGQTTNSINVSPSQTTTYTVIATTNTCSIQDQVTVTVESLFVASAGEDERVCQNDAYEVVLTANQGDSYLWNTGETTQSITVSPSSTSTYSVTVTQGIQNDVDDVTVFVDPNPSVIISNGDSIDIMNGEFVTLSASGANTYEWDNGATQPNIAVSPPITTTYQVKGFIGNCYDEKQITVNVIPEVIADAGEDVVICLDESTLLTASGGDEYVWSTGETTQSIEVSPTLNTTYTVTVFNTLDFDEDTVTVEVDANCNVEPIEDDPENFDFEIFPNPTSNVFNIKLSGSDLLTHIYLYDITGKLIHSVRISNENQSDSSTTRFNVRNLEAGIYYVKLVDIHRELSKKLIVK